MTPQDWQALKNGDLTKFVDNEIAALQYAEKLTREPWSVQDNDLGGLKQHFSEAQVVDLHLLAGVINLTNRFTDPLGLELEMPEEKI